MCFMLYFHLKGRYMTKFIKEKFNCDVTTLANTGIEVKRSAQVRLGKLEPMRYYELTSSDLGKGHGACMGKEVETEANLVSYNNQKLLDGDIVISARTKLNRVFLYNKKRQSRSPLVPANGLIVIRTKNLDLAEFIEYYLSLAEVQEYINNNPEIKNQATGRIAISTDFIENLPFPAVLGSDFSVFTKNKKEMYSISFMLSKARNALNNNTDETLQQVYKKDMMDDTSYNIEELKQFKDEFKKLINEHPKLFKGLDLQDE